MFDNYSNLYPKFIIEGENLILAKVKYHKDLVFDDNKKNEKKNILGGGFFNYNSETSTFIFSQSSHDFGSVTAEQIKNCIENDKVFTNRRLTRSIAKKHKFIHIAQCGTQTKLN